MKYDDLEKTQDLFDIEEVPSPIENIEMEGANKDNLTEEFPLNEEENSISENEVKEIPEEPKIEEQPKKAKKPKNKKKLTKKQKILLIVALVLLLILIIVIVLVFCLKKPEAEKPSGNEPEKPSVIVEKENYIYRDGVLTFLDLNDNELGTYKCSNADEKSCYVAYYNDEDDFDVEKNVYENGDEVERRSKIYLDRYVFINDNETEEGNIILYDIEEEKTLGTYALVKGFSDSNYVILKDENNKYGAGSFTEDGFVQKIEFSFDYLGMMDKDAKVVAKDKNSYYIYTQSGKIESRGLAFEVKSYNDKYIVVSDNGAYYVYDYRNNLIFDEEYQYIELLNDYALLINDKELYIKDYENNKYNEEAITIRDKNYVKKNVYDKNKTLVDTKKAFDLTQENNSISIKYVANNAEKSILVNLLEGKLSAKYNYLNYFDGTLYFYSDEDKTELIGKYVCTNKNIIDKNSTNFNNCMLATEDFFSKNEVEVDNTENVGIIPIINNRYVFISDVIDAKTPTIVLYDLKDKKAISKVYQHVDLGLYSKEDNVTLLDVKEILAIIENKNGKYGVINLGDKVTSVIPFNYAKIEKLRDYYMTTSSTNTYMLVNNKGASITEKLGHKIVDYKGENLVMMDNDGKYQISDFTGSHVDSNVYLDIKLEDNFYVVIDTEGKLNIGNYSDYALVFPSGVEIGSNYKNNYEVTKNENGYAIKIKDSNKTIQVDSIGNVIS